MNKQNKKTKIKNPARYRLDFIKENTFNRVWTISMTRSRVVLVSAAVAAAGAALVWCIIAFTPLRRLLPGYLKGDLRTQYVEAALRLDSLDQAARRNSAYIQNIIDIMSDRVAEAPAHAEPDTAAIARAVADSLLAASEAEKRFVRSYEEEERFNLSVLAPIAAEGMVFTAPAPAAQILNTESSPTTALLFNSSRATPIAAVYRGTVVAITTAPDGRSTITIQHPNDFISVYSGLTEVYVDKGRKIVAGQRLGHADGSTPAAFELWHNGSALDPRQYILF